MKKIKQLADCSVSIRRIDNAQQVDFSLNVVREVDDETGTYLIKMKVYDEEGNIQTDFVETDEPPTA